MKRTMEEIEKQMEEEGYDTYKEFVLADIGVFYEEKVMDLMKGNSFFLIFETKFGKVHSIYNFRNIDNDVFNDMFYFEDIDEVKTFEKGMTFDKDELVYWLKIYYNLDEEKNWIIFTDEDRKKTLKENLKRIYQTFFGYDFVPNVPRVHNEIVDFYRYFYI